MPQPLQFLIADPLEGVRQFAQQLLLGLGFEATQLHCAAHLGEAAELAATWPPDFLITDAYAHRQPDALAFYAQLRAQHPHCLLGLTGFELSPELRTRAEALHAQFVLAKPFSAAQLRSTLQASLDWMARERPELAARLAAQSRGRLDARQGRRIELPALALPKPFVIGEQVRHQGVARKITAVVIRHGEQLLQLDGVAGWVPADKISR